jgi:hypothetical protein
MMNTTQATPHSVEVPLASLIELAVENWRLERWLAKLDQEESIAHGRHVARQLNRFLSERELAVLDLAGQPYEPGLAVEVLDVIHEPEMPGDTEMIDETVTPIVMWRGAVVQFGQVIVRRREVVSNQ